MAALEEVAKETLPPENSTTGPTSRTRSGKASGTTTTVFGLSLVFVFLILGRAIRELVPAILGAAHRPRSGLRCISWQSGCAVTTLASMRRSTDRVDWPRAKNAILIVEFAKAELEKGRDLIDAALEGARLRLRPILMTSFAFILGSAPLWIASAQAQKRVASSAPSDCRMLAATCIAIFIIL